MKIDVDFDVRTDSGSRDPDYASKTLREFHQILWSKPLPSGDYMELQYLPNSYHYLIFESKLGTMFLSSDSVTNSMTFHKKMEPILSQIPKEQIEHFKTVGSTIGSKVLFPGKKVDGFQTINQARGFSTAIKDRFDLTLECIRLFYLNEPSPLRDTFERYSDFFGLFGDFQGYVDFFLLQDLVENGEVKPFFLPFDLFGTTGPYPKSTDEYIIYMNNSIEFVKARNNRIRDLT